MRCLTILLLFSFFVTGITGCGRTDGSEADNTNAGSEPSNDVPEIAASVPELDPKSQVIVDALEIYRQSDALLTDEWSRSYDEEIARVKVLDAPEVVEIVKRLNRAKQVGGFPPCTPDDAEEIHRLFCDRAAAAVQVIEAYDNAIEHFTLAGETERVNAIRPLRDQFKKDLNLSDTQLKYLANPEAQWKAEVFAVTVDSRLHSRLNRAVLDVGLAPGNVLYIFPNLEDRWRGSSTPDVDFLGHSDTEGIHNMRLRFFYGRTHPKQTVLGQRVILTASNPIGFYCNGGPHAQNSGQIRVTVVAMRP